MASRSSYINRGPPPSLRPLPAEAPRSARSGRMRGPGQERARRSVLGPVTRSFYLILASSAHTRPRDFFLARFRNSERLISLPVSRSVVCACASSALPPRQSAGDVRGFKGGERPHTLLKLLPDRYFLNELSFASVSSVSQQRLRRLLDLSSAEAARLFGDICSRPGLFVPPLPRP